MQLENKTNYLGVIISSIVLLAVGSVTFFYEKGTPVAQPISTVPSNVPTVPITPTPITKIPTPVTKTPTPTPVVKTPPPAVVPKQTSAYKDGTYSATGSYMSPGGQDQIAVTLTLTNDIITNVSVTPMAGDRTSSRYQSRFISGYQPLVLGKNIADVNLDYVSGASLTPIGFNDALAQIKAQAKA